MEKDKVEIIFGCEVHETIYLHHDQLVGSPSAVAKLRKANEAMIKYVEEKEAEFARMENAWRQKYAEKK